MRSPRFLPIELLARDESARRSAKRVCGIAILGQSNRWSCGPHAIRHALACLGIDVTVETIVEATGADESGTCERGLARGAAIVGRSLGQVSFGNAGLARSWLFRALGRGPVVVPVDRWSHWVALAAASAGKIIVLDSARPGPVDEPLSGRAPVVVRSNGWEHFARRWRSGESDPVFVAYPIRSPRSGAYRPRFTT